MKKFLSVLFFASLLSGVSAASRDFIEGTDYFTDFKQNEENMAAVVHVNFIHIQPSPAEAETIIKDQLKVYGNILEAEKENAAKEQEALEKDKKKSKSKTKEKPKRAEEITGPEELKAFFEEEDAKEEKFKNIIGSVWYTSDGNPENMEKVQYSDTSSAFVWLGKTKKIVPFPEYIKILKKEKDDKKQKDKERAQLIKQLSKKNIPEEMHPEETEEELP